MIKKSTILVMSLFLFAGTVKAGFDYDYQFTNCYINGAWSSATYCEDDGDDCSRYIAHPCPPPPEQ